MLARKQYPGGSGSGKTPFASMQGSALLTSMSSLSPSALDNALMDMLNIPKDGSTLQRICLANPITRTGKKLQLLRMLGIALVPILLLLSYTGYLLAKRVADNLQSADISNYLRLGTELSELLNNLQKERDMSVLYVSSISPESKEFLVQSYPITDDTVQSLREWPALDHDSYFRSRDAFLNHLNSHRYNLEANDSTMDQELQFYGDIIGRIKNWLYTSLQEASGGVVWKDLVALVEMSESQDAFGIERAMGTLFFSQGGFKIRELLLEFLRAQDVGNQTLNNARLYSEKVDEFWNDTRTENMEELLTIRDMRHQIQQATLDETGLNASLADARRWFDAMTFYLDQLKWAKSNLSIQINDILDERRAEDQQVIAIIATIFAFVLVLSPVILRAVASLTTNIQTYSITLADRTRALRREQKRIDSLLYQLLPRQLAEKMKRNEAVEAEAFDEVTVYFNDMVGFTQICSISSPVQVVGMLNALYTNLDAVLSKYDVYKVETIGDAYMVASGVPHCNGDRHASEIATMALDVLDTLSQLEIPHIPGRTYSIRSGFHTGPVVAGIIGDKMPRYTLFGDTVARAAEMEKTGKEGKVQFTINSRALLLRGGEFVMTAREDIKSHSLNIETFWLIHRKGMERSHSPKNITSSESDVGDELLEVALHREKRATQISSDANSDSNC